MSRHGRGAAGLGGRFGRLRRRLLLMVAVSSALLVVALNAAGAFDALERSSYDARMSLSGPSPGPRDIVIVAIDDATFGDLRVLNISRFRHAKVVEALRRDGARAIGYDVQFSGETNPEATFALYDAITRFRGVVLATTSVDPDGPSKSDVFGNDDNVRAAHAVVASTNFRPDPGGVARHWSTSVDTLTSFPVALAERWEGRRITPGDLGGSRFYVDFHKPNSFKTVSFSDVVRGRFPRGTFRGKAVFIGATAPSLNDIHATPLNSTTPGVEMLASAFDTVRRGAPLRDVPGWIGTVLTLLMAGVGPLLNLRRGPLGALTFTILVGATYAGVTLLLFAHGGDVLPVSEPLVAILLAAIGAIVVHYITEAFERMRARDVFGRFVSDSIARKVMDEGGDQISLASDRMECTVMFTDLRGFTTYSEANEPEEVVAVLNAYLTEMSGSILDHGGTLTAYLGDGIMALFGAPYEQEDHAERALAASRDMLDRLERFNAWMADTGRDARFRIGIGLNSGPVMVGTVGSERRLEYTGIGDAVNTAARVEGMTKGFERQVLLCESTKERLLAEHPELVYVGEQEVRGRSAPVRLWGLDTEGPTAAAHDAVPAVGAGEADAG